MTTREQPIPYIDFEPIWNVSIRKVGGIWFASFGRLCFSFCVKRAVQ